MLIEMHICTFFNPKLTWREQLAPVIGQDEVKKLDAKLHEINIPNLDSVHVFYSSMFSSPPPHLEDKFTELLRDIGDWPSVRVAFTQSYFLFWSFPPRIILSIFCSP